MSKKNLSAVVDAFRAFVLQQGCSIVGEKEIEYGYQLVVTDGLDKTPVNLYATGKTLVQGKPCPLQTKIKAWRYGQQALSQSELWNADTLPLVQPVVEPEQPVEIPAELDAYLRSWNTHND